MLARTQPTWAYQTSRIALLLGKVDIGKNGQVSRLGRTGRSTDKKESVRRRWLLGTVD